MELLLIRHGDAIDDAPGLGDAGRWLSGRGRIATRRVASFLVANESRRPIEIWTSPLVRAVQTAEIVAEAARLTDRVIVLDALGTHGSVGTVAAALQRQRPAGPVALVGHEPGLSVLALRLLGDVPWSGFSKSSVLAVAWPGEGVASFRWVLDPHTMTTIDTLEELR